MKYQVLKKQYNSKMCLVCGLANDFGLKAAFYELENGELAGVFTPRDEHQSYPGRLHGGITGAILDETICRAIMIQEENTWGVTAELNIKYIKPAPLDGPLKVVGRITRNTRKIFEGTAEMLLANGEIAATAFGKYMKIPLEKITGAEAQEEEWRVSYGENEPDTLELP